MAPKHLPLKSMAALAILAWLTGCSSSGGSGYTTVGVHYGYPYYGPGWGYYPHPCCWDDDRPHRPNRPDKPNRPGKPGGPSIQPIEKPGRPGSGGPSIQPVQRPSSRPRPPSSMGRPAPRPTMRAPRAMPRMGGGRRR